MVDSSDWYESDTVFRLRVGRVGIVGARARAQVKLVLVLELCHGVLVRRASGRVDDCAGVNRAIGQDVGGANLRVVVVKTSYQGVAAALA
jgi:hypothetical protein